MLRRAWSFWLALMLTGCSQPSKAPVTAALYAYRSAPSALLELAASGTVTRELPLAIPGGCRLDELFAPPAGAALVVQVNCEFGQAVLFVDTRSGQARQPVTDSDSHFLAWASDGQSAYLKVDTMGRPRIVRASLNGKPRLVPITELTYDLSPKPGTAADFLFSFSRGMGLGSEMWMARDGGRVVQLVRADPDHYLSFARWSPDGSRIAFIRVPDTSTPFTVGELWVMQADGSGARLLGAADAGHGFAEAWSADGKRIAYVVRENPGDAQADQDASALRSNIVLVETSGGAPATVTHFANGRALAPAWSPDGNRLAFTVVLDDKMSVYTAELATGEVRELVPASTCCPAWVLK